MKKLNIVKTKRLRLILDTYRNSTAAGNWITPLNPDNISIEFIAMRKPFSVSFNTRTIYLNTQYEVIHTFPYYIQALWEIKQQRSSKLTYWFYKIFKPSRIDIPSSDKATIARNWLIQNVQ